MAEDAITRRARRILLGLVSLATIFSGCSDKNAGGVQPSPARADLIKYDRALKENPDDLAARLGLADAHIRLGEADRALPMLRAVARQAPDTEVALLLAEAYLYLGQITEAQAALIRARERGAGEGEFADRFAGLSAWAAAEAAFGESRFDDAAESIGTARTVERIARPATLMAARLAYVQGDLSRAQDVLASLGQDAALSRPGRLLSAQTSLRQGDFRAAEERAAEILASVPGDAAASVIAVEAALRQGDLATAKAYAEKMTKAASNDPRPAFVNALVLAAEGEYRAAADAAGPIEDWLIEVPGGATLLAELKKQTGQPAQAETLLKRRLVAAPDDAAALTSLVRLFDDQGRVSDGDELMAEALAADNPAGALYRLQVQRLSSRGEWDAAMALLSQDVPSSEQPILTYAALASQNVEGAPVDPFALLAAARAGVVEAFPDDIETQNPVLRNLYAAALATSGRENDAIAALDSLIETHPDFLAAIFNRARLSDALNADRQALEAAASAGALSADVWSRLAEARYVDGDATGAIQAANRVSAERPEDASVLRATIYYLEDDMTAARKALEGVPKSGRVDSLQAAIVAKSSGDAAAARYFQSRFAKDPSRLTLGLSWLERVARIDLETAYVILQTDGRLAPLRTPLVEAGLALEAEKADRAVELIEPAEEGAAKAALQAAIALAQGENATARALMQSSLREMPDDPVALNNFALAMKEDDLAAARTFAERAYRLSGGAPEIGETLAQIVEASGEAELAMRLRRRAYLAAPWLAP